MAVYVGSRFEGAYTFLDEDTGITYLDPIPVPKYSADMEDMVIVIDEGMRLDLIANEFYGDPDYEWVIMEANPGLTSPFEIKPGDQIYVPSPDRVIGDA
ncbi:hypothetical protein D1872_130170 [compost metagenome]